MAFYTKELASAQDREAYEQYLLATTEEAQVKALDKFIIGSSTYNFLLLLTRQKYHGSKLSVSDQKLFDNISNSELKLRAVLLEFDEATTEAKRKEVLDKVISQVGFPISSHTKPYDIQHQGTDQTEETKDQAAARVEQATVDKSTYEKDWLADLKSNADFNTKHYKDDWNLQSSTLKEAPLHLVHSIDFNWYFPYTVYDYVQQLARADQLAGIKNQSLFKQFKQAMVDYQKDSSYWNLDKQICDKMTLEQLKELKGFSNSRTDPNIIGSSFTKEFCEELSPENQELMTSEEKLRNLEYLHNAAKNAGMPKSMQMTLLGAILQIAPKAGVYNKDLFKQYVKYIELRYGGGGVGSLISNAVKSAMFDSHKDFDWSPFLNTVYNGFYQGNEHAIAMDYLEHFCYENKGSLSEFFNKNAEFLNKEMLQSIEDKVQIYLATNGMNDLKKNDRIDAAMFKRHADEVSLKFLQVTKEKFSVQETVKLHVEVKNVSTVHCKVFEFNTETYYRKNLKPFDTTIDLDGLESTITKEFPFNYPSNYKKKEVFEFPELNNKVGLFIIELVGNGRSARAVVKKGSLSLIHRSTPAGHMVYILDEDKKICRSDRTGLWLNKKWYAADEKEGSIFIPYTQHENDTKVIMQHGDFAQLGQFMHKTESYNLNAKFFISSESILVGQNAVIVVRPTLTINKRKANLNLLRNARVTLRTQNYIDKTPVTKKFENLKFEDNVDLTVDFQVPPNLDNVQVDFSADVLNTTTKKMQTFTESKSFNVTSHKDSQEICEVYLKMAEEDKYEVLCLGKNGEPRPHMRFEVQFVHAYNGTSAQGGLITDEEGKLYLGQLPNIVSVKAHCVDHSSLKKSWNLPSLTSDTWQYPLQIDVLEGGSAELPVAHMYDPSKPNALKREQTTLYRSRMGTVVDDWFTNIKVIKKEKENGSHYFLLKVEKLEQGEYTWQLRGAHNVTVKIVVHKGQYWNNLENFILKKNCIQELVSSQKILKIKESSIDAKKEKLVVKLADYTPNARVHVFATKFVQPALDATYNQIQNQLHQAISSSVFTFAQWKNLLMSDRKLSDEYRYVFDRANAQRQLGNTLDRPQLLNKRLFTRKTEIEQEVLNAGSDFAQMQEQMAPAMMQSIQPMQQEAFGYQSRGMHQAQGSGGNLGLKPNPYPVQVDYIPEFQNFLKNAPIQAFNLKPNANGEVVYENSKLGDYNTLTILVIDKDSAVQNVRNLREKAGRPIEKRDLTLKKALDENKGLTESRLTNTLPKGSKDFIEDFTSSEIQLIDDLKKVSEVLREIAKISGQTSSAWDKLNFIQRWPKLSEDDKKTFLSEYFSHELLFFIKAKDTAFFESTIRNVLASKMEKNFFDHYLLDNIETLVKFAQPHMLISLNALERCFLIDALVKHSKSTNDPSFHQTAASLVARIRDQVEGSESLGGDKRKQQNRLFDLVLNMNSLNKDTSSMLLSGPPSAPGAPMMMAASSAPRMRTAMMRAASYDEEEDDCEMMEMENAGNFGNDYGNEAQIDPFSNSNAVNNMMSQYNANISTQKYEQLEATSEYMETHYYNTKLSGGFSTVGLIQDNAFWADYAEFLLNRQSENEPFLSAKFTECSSPIQSFFAFCVLGMDFETANSAHSFVADESRGVHITAGSNLILYKKEIKEVQVHLRNDFMVCHRYHREDQYGKSTKTDDDEAIPNEFLINVPYRCQVIMTNVSPQPKEFNLLYQIPHGSLPMRYSKQMKSEPRTLRPYSTEFLDFYFYFPEAGVRGHYPSNVSIDERVTARGEFNRLNVVKKRTIEKAENIDDLVQVGTPQQILEFIRTTNLFDQTKGFNFQKILFLCKEKDFWTSLIQILRQRNIYDQSVWQYALVHKTDIPAIREYLMMKTNFQQRVGIHFESTLFSNSPQIESDTGFTKHLEYNPMINSRAHKIGQEGAFKILNKTFRQTYDSFLQTTAYKKKLSFADKLVFVYFLQLQDRINDAIELFKTINPDELKAEEAGLDDCGILEMQYDYLSAYFDFFTGAEDNYVVARRVVQRYDDYPISSWRLMFLAIQDQLNEFDGEFDDGFQEGDDQGSVSELSGSDASLRLAERKQENMKASKMREPTISQINVDEKGKLTIESVNIKELKIKYYMIDAEILFSRAPFLKNNADEFSYVKPFLALTQTMVADGAEAQELSQYVTKEVALPESLKHQNLVIEIQGENQQEFRTFYSSAVKVSILESYGEMKVTHQETGKALSKVYIKVFAANKNGTETFYRDGYTDIRGKFEYSQASGDKLKSVSKFAILIQSHDLGSQIREVEPPKDESLPVVGAPVKGFAANLQQKSVQISDYSNLQNAKYTRMLNRNNYVQSKRKC